MYLSVLIVAVFPMLIICKSNSNNISSSTSEPINPKLEAKTEKIKSVPASGKYSGVLLNPCPNRPLEPIADNELVSCIPLPDCQLIILSIL